MFLSLKGSLLGFVIFLVGTIPYIMLRMYLVARTIARPAGTSVGISTSVFKLWTYQNAFWWISLVLICAAMSMLLRSRV
jgi:hypothetical protein